MNEKIIKEQLIPLLQTQRDHIETQHRIILQIQKELKLAIDKQCDDEERKVIINELIEFIDKLDIEEKK